jgi:membrane protease YdiL (CAAX protease family)
MQTVEPEVVPATPSRWSILRSCIVDCLIALGLYFAVMSVIDMARPTAPARWQHVDRWWIVPRSGDESRLARWASREPDVSHVKVSHDAQNYTVVSYQTTEPDNKLWPEWLIKETHTQYVDRDTQKVKSPYEWWDDWVLGFAVLSLGLWRMRRSLRDGVPILRPFTGRPVRALIWGVVLGVPVSGAWYFALNAIPWYPGSRSSELEHAVFPTASASVVAAILMWSWLLAPIGEEVFCRGAIYGRLAAAGYVRFGAVASAVLFALLHFDATMLAPAFIMGLVAAALYSRTRSILAPISFHVMCNVTQLVCSHLHLHLW